MIQVGRQILDSLNFDKDRKIRKDLSLINLRKDKNFFDYGVGYFYQSFGKLKIRGLRDTLYRKEIINLDKFTQNKKILDIGTNSGFLLMELNNNFNNALGIDYNPKLIQLANKVKDYLQISNINFKTINFETENIDGPFDVVLSLANHHTYDGGISSTEKYFQKIFSLLNSEGILVIESHHPKLETTEKFMNLIESLNNDYKILCEIKYRSKNFLDDGRTTVILQKTTHQ